MEDSKIIEFCNDEIDRIIEALGNDEPIRASENVLSAEMSVYQKIIDFIEEGNDINGEYQQDVVKEKILELYPEYNKVFGVYTRKDGRQFLVLTEEGFTGHNQRLKKTISYPKAVMEVYLKRRLRDNETVDHKDKNVLNNDISNLHILDIIEHLKLDAKRVKPVTRNCIYCGAEFTMTARQIRRYNTYKTAPLCSSKCSGLYGSEVQLGLRKRVDFEPIETEYYCNKDLLGIKHTVDYNSSQ